MSSEGCKPYYGLGASCGGISPIIFENFLALGRVQFLEDSRLARGTNVVELFLHALIIVPVIVEHERDAISLLRSQIQVRAELLKNIFFRRDPGFGV